jgi:HAE1 family hydrophobic/amphiphilic exporter-1
MEDAYIGLVSRMVQRPKLTVLVFAAIIAVSGWQFARHPTGFLPQDDQGYAIVIVKLPNAAAQPRVMATVRQLNEIIKNTRGIAAWVTFGGYSALDAANVSNVSTTFIVYDDWSKRGADLSQDNILGHLRQGVASIENATIFVMVPPPIRGLGQSGGFQMMVEDRESRGLALLEKSVQGVVSAAGSQSCLRNLNTTFSASSPQLYLDIDRPKVESLQVQLADVFNTLQSFLGSTFVKLFNKFNQVFQVYVQADAPYRLYPQDLANLYVRNSMGQMVPLSSLMKFTHTLGSELVTRYNLYPAAPIIGIAAPGFSSGQALNLMEQVAGGTLPEGLSYDWTATAYQEKQVGRTAYFIYALSITLVFMVLAALYESWTSPAAVILVVPLALVGVIVALIVRGFETDLYTQVGLVLMIALASKNAILIVEYARDLHARGMSVAEAAVEATRRRFRPIIMTSFAFILGVSPLLYASDAGAASQRDIGTVVFGGMLSSTLLAIPFVPVFFVIMQRLSERRSRLKH